MAPRGPDARTAMVNFLSFQEGSGLPLSALAKASSAVFCPKAAVSSS